MSPLSPLHRPDADPAAGPLDARPLGLYVHYPLCTVRCPYCDFAVDTRTDFPHVAYADAIVQELQVRAPWFAGTTGLVSIYFGGGTPGLWPAAQVARVIARGAQVFGARAGDLEITIEANPGEVTEAHLQALRDAGVNRISLGLQAFDDHLLTQIGRTHTGRQVAQAVEMVLRLGFPQLSCDLMFGLPGQTSEHLDAAIDRLIDLGPNNVSCYGLTIERGTTFGKLDRAGKLDRPDDDTVAHFYESLQDRLGAAGFAQYEVSSFARPGGRAVHNQLYWTGGAYLGVGCSASSFRPLHDGSGFRFTNPRATDTYLQAVKSGTGNPTPALIEKRSAAELERESLWLGLRTADGVNRAAHARRFGADPLATSERAQAASSLVKAGWLAVDPETIRPTKAGFLFADEVAQRLCF